MKNSLLRWLQWSTSCGKLRSKLLCIYFLLIVIPLGMFSLYAYLRVKSVIQEQTFSAAQNAFDDTCLSLEHLLGRLDGVIDILSTDSLIYTMASNDPRDFTYIRRLEDSDQLATTFEHLRVLSGVDRIRLYVGNDYPYSNTRTNIVQISRIEQSGWYHAAQGRRRLWCAPADLGESSETGQPCFSSIQMVYNPRSVKEPLAILRADIDARRVQELVSGTSITENGLLLLLRGDEVLLASDPDIPLSRLDTLVEQLHGSCAGAWTTIQANGTDYYVQSKGIGPSGWRIASILPYRDVFRLSHELSIEMLVIVIAVALAAYLLAYLTSQSTLKRISQLTGTMQAVEKGNVTVRLEPSGNDEIAQLMDGFNQMMDRVDTLMEERVEYGRQIKNLELKALQAQINPHFLYNSLDLINCTAISRNVPEISRMVNALGRFYRLSLSKGREVIPLSDELKHAQLYVEIQNLRFENRVSVRWALDPAAAQCRIIKIVLQPLVENAIYHGIKRRRGRGQITVTGRRQAGGMYFAVEDNGMGMTPERLAEVRASLQNGAPLDPDGKGGYGLRNVEQRLRLYYGCGLTIESEYRHGTRISFTVPDEQEGKTL